MMLGQPTTAVERAEEQACLEHQWQRALWRNRAIVLEVRHAVLDGATFDAACLRAARAHKLGRGGASYVRGLCAPA